MSEPVLERAWHDLTSHFPHHRYHDHNETPPPEAPMSLLQTIRDEFSQALTWGEDELRAKLPTVARLADDAEKATTSPLAQVVASAVLPPAVEQSFADMIARVDAELRAAAGHQDAAPGSEALAQDSSPEPAEVPAG